MQALRLRRALTSRCTALHRPLAPPPTATPSPLPRPTLQKTPSPSSLSQFSRFCSEGRERKLFQSRCFSTSNLSPPNFPFSTAPPSAENDVDALRSSRPMDFVRATIQQDGSLLGGAEHNADFVQINIMRNNTFVTITDLKGNKKFGASMGCVDELKGGQKMTRYVTEATAEHAGRAARSLGLNSVVVRVKGFTYFRKKRQAIMSFMEGYGGRNPIVSIEDTTRRAHNGCRLPKKRRI